jgi:hypothetical protein
MNWSETEMVSSQNKMLLPLSKLTLSLKSAETRRQCAQLTRHGLRAAR